MTVEKIRQLARYLDATLQGRAWPFRHPGAVTRQDREARSLADPAFGARFVLAIHELNIPLPDWLHEDSVRHAYQYIRHGIERPHVLEAYRLASPSGSELAAVLDGMLVSLDTPLERISELLGRSVESLRQYADLFFNVRDRADDPAYLTNIVYPGTRLASLDASNPPRVRQQLLQAGYEQGAEQVAFLAGLHGNRGDTVAKDAVGALERQLLTRATMMVRHGQLEPATLLRHATAVVARRKVEPAPEPQDAGGITSLGDCVLRELDRLASAGK
jgi:hypothetical protein